MTVLTLEGINVLDVAQTVPNTAILTDGTVSGDGVFDILMQVTKLHLLEEWNENRITGKEYSTVYLGALNAVMQQAIGYIMNHQQAAQITAEVGLTRQKTATELSQTDDSIPIGLGFNATTEVKGLVAEQKLLNEQQILLATSQVEESTQNIVLVGQKIITELAQTDTDIGAVAATYGLNNSSVMTGLVEGQLLKLNSETDLTKQKVMTELAGTADNVILSYAKNTSTTIGGLMKEQIDKVEAEVQLLDQKSVTELAQTDDTIPAGTGISSNPAVTGVVGKQKTLFTAQTDGFARDAEQKLVKIMVDPFIAALAGDSSTTVPPELSNPSLDQVLVIAKDGIGAPPVPA